MEEGAGTARGGAPSSWSDFWELAAWPFSSPSFAPAATGFLPSAQQTVVARGRDNRAPNQHRRLTCLKLGKRQYYGEQQSVEASRKRERPPPPRCQVDGCSKVLVAEKQYHKRHKVCETHSKAHKVVLLGLDQRFCQQCSRFHEVSEFDDFKRSCRRRLAGHNKRRRKNSSADSIARSPALLESAMNEGMAPSFLAAPPGCAPSLLSSKASAPWIATVPDFSSRSSAALNELIAENRAALLARQLFIDQGGRAMIQASPQPPAEQQLRPFSWPHQQAQQVISPPAAKHLTGGSHVTLDLMQMPGSFEIVSATGK